MAGMRLLYFLADTFVNTFGITQPTERARKQAAFFILGLIILTLLGGGCSGLCGLQQPALRLDSK